MLRTLTVFGIVFHLYNVMLFVGIIGIGLQMERALAKGAFTERQRTAVRLCVPLGVLIAPIGAYVLHNMLRTHAFDWRHWELGFAFYGMWLTVLPLSWLFSRLGGMRWVEMLNFHAVGLAFAHACGRIGCFLGGCCFGCPVRWGGVRYPLASFPGQHYPGIALCPVQLYEAALLLALAFVLERRVAFRNRFLVYLASYAVFRFVIEFFRGDPRGAIAHVLPLSPAQVISVALAVFCFCWVSYRGLLLRRVGLAT